MISTELRIGNWVEIIDSKDLCTKVEKSTFDCNIEKNYKPIPLTEQWLLNFGFDFSIDTWYLKGVAIWKTECCDAKGNEEIGFFYELRDVGMMDMHIKYVHQLQNLYFALTGEELIIK